jgi:hypothetical protein
VTGVATRIYRWGARMSGARQELPGGLAGIKQSNCLSRNLFPVAGKTIKPWSGYLRRPNAKHGAARYYRSEREDCRKHYPTRLMVHHLRASIIFVDRPEEGNPPVKLFVRVCFLIAKQEIRRDTYAPPAP